MKEGGYPVVNGDEKRLHGTEQGHGENNGKPEHDDTTNNNAQASNKYGYVGACSGVYGRGDALILFMGAGAL